MDIRLAPSLAESIAAAQAWWREAGVDHDFHDEPRAWLTDPAAEAPQAPAATKPQPEPAPAPLAGGDRAAWPRDLAAFRQWWLEEPSLDHGGTNPRIPPRGEANAPLMILVPMPEAGDRETLLSGPEGRLLASLVTAMDLAPEAVYFASALPRHTPLPDWNGLAASGHGAILAHHIELAAPERLMVFGRSILPLLGHDPAQAAPLPGEFAIQGCKLPLLVSYAPGRLIANARQRAGLWRRWLDWTG